MPRHNAQKVGKQFEKDIKDSVPDNWFYYRFRDGTANFAGKSNNNVRFQMNNMADCMLFTGQKLLILELKTFKGKSFPFSNIRQKQIFEMRQADSFHNIHSYFIINARDYEETFIVPVDDLISILLTSDKKSINIDDFRKLFKPLTQHKKRVRFKFELKELINV